MCLDTFFHTCHRLTVCLSFPIAMLGDFFIVIPLLAYVTGICYQKSETDICIRSYELSTLYDPALIYHDSQTLLFSGSFYSQKSNLF